MGFLQAIVDILDSIFRSGSPEVRKRQELRKIEAELKAYRPVIYKGGMLTPNFGELFRVLYENTKPIGDILLRTISTDDLQRNMRYEQQLLLTGFSGASQERLESLGYEQRKREVLESNVPMERILEKHHRILEDLRKELNTPEFVKIDEVISGLQQLADLCRYHFMNVIHTFDPEFVGAQSDYKPHFVAVVPDSMAGSLQDLYYLTANLTLTGSIVRALIALDELLLGRPLAAEEKDELMKNVRKINTVTQKILAPDILQKVICIAKKDPKASPQVATYKTNARQKFADYMQEKCSADESKLKIEIKDLTISAEIQQIFGTHPLELLSGYDNDTNEQLQQHSSSSFMWITPLQLLKTFIKQYLSAPIMALLNDIVIEGFFSTPESKSDFSSLIYSCGELAGSIEAFEKSFERNAPNDTAVLLGFIRDSRRSTDFVARLAKSVDTINAQAYRLVQESVRKINQLTAQVGELIIDGRKSQSVVITNIKVLLNSSRNRETAELLDVQFSLWKLFLNVMKNYVAVNPIEKKAS
ncbi:MAG: hypothetical protein J1E32_00905 [Treponema sp.]|nr:hypothetical protein [Treponema sp.]